MTKALLDSIYTQINKAVSGTTSNIHFLLLPNEELLKVFTVVYAIRNTNNENTFSSKETVKTYQLEVRVNFTSIQSILTNKVFITERLYELPEQNSSVKYISLTDEDLLWDFDLKIYTGYLRFNLEYSG